MVLLRREANETRLCREQELLAINGSAAPGSGEERTIRNSLAVAPLQA